MKENKRIRKRKAYRGSLFDLAGLNNSRRGLWGGRRGVNGLNFRDGDSDGFRSGHYCKMRSELERKA
jgi:hypothetical protein